MHPSSIFFAVATAVGPMSCYAVGCVTGEPASVATAFYATSREFIHDGVGSPPLSSSLAKLVKANFTQNLETGDVGAIDWNFWTDAQDGEAAPVAKVISVRDKRGRKLVRLSYKFFPAPAAKPVSKHSDIVLVQEPGGCWLVDDVRHNGRSVSRLLAAGTSLKGSKK